MAAVRSCEGASLSPDDAQDELREGSREPLRPTREPLRPTRDGLGLAPFVAAPPLPPIAAAPRVGVTRARPSAPRIVHPASARPPAPKPVPLAPRSMESVGAPPAPRAVPRAYVVARHHRDVLAKAVVVLRARGLEITPMREAAAGSVGLAHELGRTLRRGTIGATALGAIGALVGALLVRGDALIPSWGWIPGPVVGAAFGAGVLGVVGFVIAAMTLLVAPSSTVSALAGGERALLVVGGPGSSSDVAAAIVESGGEVVAHGPR